MLEHDLIEAIIALPTDLFYNTGIQTYVWILSKNKRDERKGKIQLIDASTIYHKLRKGLGYKKMNYLLRIERRSLSYMLILKKMSLLRFMTIQNLFIENTQQ